jgi:hypothetical protein
MHAASRSHTESGEWKPFPISGKGKPNIEILGGLDVVAVELTEVQMMKLSLQVVLYYYIYHYKQYATHNNGNSAYAVERHEEP